MFTNRRPYYGLKMSTTDFFREPVRYLKESNTQESMMEKPYLEDEYPKMHLKLPGFEFKSREIPSVFGPIAGGDPSPGLAMIDFGDAKCRWKTTNVDYCTEGPVIITMSANYFWHAEFDFVAGIAADTIGVSMQQLAGTEAFAWDEQDYLLTFPEDANGSVTVCGFASAHVLVSQTFETVVAGMPVGIHLVGGALLPIERGQDKPATLLQSVYGDKGDDCGCIEISSSCVCSCSGTVIGYTTQQMAVSEVQTLIVENPVAGCTYNWSIASGGGELSSPTGESVDYTAPSSNAQCESNPTIYLSVSGLVCDSLNIAVNAIAGAYVGYDYDHVFVISTGQDECHPASGTCNGCFVYRSKCSQFVRFNCDGTFSSFDGWRCGDPNYAQQWSCTYCAEDEECPGSCAEACEYPFDAVIIQNCINTLGPQDQRLEWQMEQGCCPWQLL